MNRSFIFNGVSYTRRRGRMIKMLLGEGNDFNQALLDYMSIMFRVLNVRNAKTAIPEAEINTSLLFLRTILGSILAENLGKEVTVCKDGVQYLRDIKVDMDVDNGVITVTFNYMDLVEKYAQGFKFMILPKDGRTTYMRDLMKPKLVVDNVRTS